MIRGGRSYVSAPPAFSNDGKRLLVCTGTAVSVFSTSTALQVSSLEGHTAPLTAVIVVPASSSGGNSLCFCWTASLDGTIRYWDFSLPELMKTVDVRMPIHSMVIPSMLDHLAKGDDENKNHVFAYVSVENRNVLINPKVHENPKAKGKNDGISKWEIRKCSLTDSRMVGGLILAQSEQPEVITLGPSGKFFGIRDTCKLRIWKVPASDSERLSCKRISLHHTKKLTVFAFHPTERLVAAGDVTGRILIWRGFGSQTFSANDNAGNGRFIKNAEDRPGVRGDDEADSCSTWHWHSSEVNVLSFSSDGAYLYSGGREGVLVVWQIDTGKKKFLPRIGSQLLYFTDSSDPSLSSISCADNQIHILKMPSMEILKSISGIKLPLSVPQKTEGICSKFAFDRSAGLVALSTENYCIQFYSLFDDREVYELQVCERSHQPGDEVTVVVTSVALSLDGSTMCTTEVKLPEEGIGALVCLKFWTSDSLNKNFSLSTIIYEPHRDAVVSAVAFHPSHRMAVSSSYGGDFKLWVSSGELNPEVVKSSGWMCHSVGSYKNKPMTAAAFSADGSVLAVAAETVITLWDPENNILVAILGETQSPITSLSFAGQSDCLVSMSRGSRPQLSVWSMSKLDVSWSYKLQVEYIGCAPDSSMFAVLVLLPKSLVGNTWTTEERDGLILLFDVNGPVPTATWSVRKAKGGALAFIQGNQPSFQHNVTNAEPSQALLVYIDADHEYVVFDPLGNEAQESILTRREAIALDETRQFGYASIYGELPKFELKRSQDLVAPSGPSERPWETIFSGSSHNVPPLNKLCSAFLESLLEKRSTMVE